MTTDETILPLVLIAYFDYIKKGYKTAPPSNILIPALAILRPTTGEPLINISEYDMTTYKKI
jgi:hypothetical protein